MSNPDRVSELLSRVEAASGPDRELDCYLEAFVSRHTADGQFHIVEPPTYDQRRFFYNPLPSVDWIGYDLLNISPKYTESLDAALALAGRALPEANCIGFDKTPGEIDAYVSRNCVDAGHWYYGGNGDTPALAVLAALLRAVQAQRSRHNARDGSAPKNTEAPHDH